MEKEKKNSGKKWGLWLVSLVAMLLVFLLGRGSSRAQGMVDYTLLSRLEEQGVERAASAVFSAESSRRKVIEDQVAASLSREAHLLEFRADISRHAASLEQSIAESIESSLLQSIAESQYLAEAERALRAESVRREALDASKALAESSRLAEAESSRQAAEEAASRLAAAEASRQAAEASRQAAEESSRQAAAEASRQAAEDAARQAAEEASRQAAAEASGKAAEEASRWAAAEASRKAAEEASRQAAAEASRKASEEAAKQTAAPTTAAPTTAQAISGGETVLIGDSRTQGISYLSVWPLHLIFYTWNPIIQAPELAEKAAARFPAKAVFLNGIDDIITYGNDGAVRIYEDYIVRFSQMSPGTAIYVGSVLPILDHALVRYPQLNNLEGYNVLLQQMCARHGWTYVDGSAGFPGQAAFYEGGDGIHFHPNWTRQWFNNLRQLVGF